MAVQVSWPGVYIDEFEPGAPIQGVGTNTAVFLGIAEKGPRNTPTLVTSWDGFTAMFGGFLSDSGGWLAQGVYGFFTNGGTKCYVVRVSSAQTATVGIAARKSGDALTATALAEGPEGNGFTLVARESSRSKDAVAQAMTRNIVGVSTDRKTLTVSGGVANINAGDTVTVARGSDSKSVTVGSVSAPDQVVLSAALAGNTDFTGGTVQAGFTVRVLVASQSISAVSADRTQLTVAAAQNGFAAGDRVHVSKGADSADVLIAGVVGAVLTVTPALPGVVDYTGGGTVRSADLAANTRRLRLLTPAALSMSAAFPPGSLLMITPSAGSPVFVRVAGSGGDTVQLDAPGLPSGVALPDDWKTAPTVQTADFDLQIHSPSEPTTESFTYLSMDSRSPGYWGKAVTSARVSLALPAAPGVAADSGDDRPKALGYSTTGGQADDYTASWKKLTTTPKQFLDPLAKLRDVALVGAPGATDPVVQQALIDHCAGLQDRFAVLDPAPGLDIPGVTNQFGQVRSTKGYAALYYPWITVNNPSTGAQETWPPSGHILGVFARTDAERGVHKAPANTNIRGAVGLTDQLSDSEQGPLNLMGINILRVFPGQAQPVVWGARTTAGDLNTNWLYVNVRRLFIYLEQSIDRGIRWAVFEPNELSLWAKLKRSISDFLTQAWRDGALFGAKPEDAFYVRIDEALNPPSTRALGRLYIEVGVVPTYPAEFIVLRIGIWDGGSEITTT